MPTWAGYSLTDFLMFSPEAYFRLFELANAPPWPLPLGLPLLAAVALLPWRGAPARRVQALLLAAAWASVAGWFLAGPYAEINLAAPWFAFAFAAQALLLAATAFAAPTAADLQALRARDWPGLLLILYALLVHPVVGVLAGRDWRGVEVFGVAPDPTALATLGVLLLGNWPLGRTLTAIPLLWCAVTGLTFVAMGVAHGLAAPAAALAALGARYWLSR